jgi:hypothetical protein
MKLFEMFRTKKTAIVEGGNVSSQSPGWQGAADQEAEEIDLKIHDRDHMVGQLRTLLAAQNESFKAAYGKYIWEPKLLNSGKMFSGSSLQFFDVKGVNTQDFLNKLKKTKVGDIDTQINQDMGEEVTAWLKSIIGKKIGNGTFLGFNSSLSSIWLLDDPQVRIQVDYELGPYDAKTKSPTEWFAYSHSSHYDDMAAGIKGVFHKYINRALTHAQSSEKYVARVLKKGVKISPEPVTDSDYSFAVTSAQGGGMSLKYKPYIDPATGEPMEKDGVPVMQLLDPKDRDYIQNLDQQFQINFGRKRGAADQKLQGSFVGTIQLMNKAFSTEQNEAVARAFLNILFGPGEQMIYKGDPVRDRDVKFAAVDAMLLGGGGVKPLNLPDGQSLRQEAVKMAMDYAEKFKAKKAGATKDTEVAEDADAVAAAKPNYARQGIKHIYNRLPDGRVSSMEMKDAEFIELCKEIADNGGNLNGMAVNLKVDGAGIRFGKDSSGRPFFMTSKVTTPLYQDDVGYFTSFGQEKGQDAETLARTKKYDDALALITGSKFIESLPSDTIVQAEMMYVPMAQKTDQGLKFVNISYDPKKLGRQMTLVPFMVKQYSTGEELPAADKIIKRLIAASDNNVKIISNRLEQKGINVSKIIQPVLDLDPKNKENKPTFDQAKQALSDAIINSPKLTGKDALGDNMEGIVVNLPSGGLFKVTSSQMKNAMAAKMAPTTDSQSFGDKQTRTAVVATGNFAGHRGHEQLIDMTIEKAKELGGTPFVFVGRKVGKDDPIDLNTKIETLRKLYPGVDIRLVQNQIDATGKETQGSDLKKVEMELVKKAPYYNNILIAVGSDQVPSMTARTEKVTQRFSTYPPLAHVKAGVFPTPRGADEGGTGVSTTKLRDALKNLPEEEAFKVWSEAYNVQKLGVDWIKHLMDIARSNMNIQQPVPQQPAPQPGVQQPAQQPQPVAETRLFNALVRPRLTETARTSAAAKLSKAWDQQQQKSAASRERAEKAKAEFEKEWKAKQEKEKGVAEGEYNPDTFVGKKGTYKGYGITQEGPYQWGISSSLRKFTTLAAAKRHIDKNMSEGVAEGADRAEAQADYMEGQCMVLAVAINQHNPKRYPIGYIWEYNMSAGAPDMQMDDDEWNDLSPEEQEEISNDISRHSVVHAYVRDQETNEYIDARGRHKTLPNLWGRMGQTRFEEFPGSARELIDITAHGDWDEVGDQVSFKRGRPAFDSLAGPAGVKRALDYAVKYLGVVGPELVKSPNVPQNQQGVAEAGSNAMADTAKRLADKDDGKVAKLRAAGDKKRDSQYMGTQIAKNDQTSKDNWGNLKEKIKGVDGKACWKGKRYAGKVKKADGTYKDKCVPVSENVENIMGALIDRIIVNEAISHNKR